MGKTCAAYGCSNSNYKEKDKGKGISLHKFPKESTLRKQWAFAMKRKGFQPTNYSFVCSVHFKPEDFEVDEKFQKDRKFVHLKKNVIPTIFTAGLPSHVIFLRVREQRNIFTARCPTDRGSGSSCPSSSAQCLRRRL